jgi:FMN-dependent oxidoreductase (nitrilotriacetate monooxygenase family)
MTPFSLGLLVNFAPPAWMCDDDRLYGDDWWTGQFFVDMARRLEAAKMDYLFLLDTLAVRRDAEGSMDEALRQGASAPSHDPMTLMSMVAAGTEKLGIIGTASTTFYPPYLLARLFSTLDSISGGRTGWNIVTSYDTNESRNYGMDALPDHAERYASAAEYLEVTRKLWQSWEADAVVADPERDIYVDGSKVHSVDHVGERFSVQGPLNTLRSPQGIPFLAQAGASENGRRFAARNAELSFVDSGDCDPLRLRQVRDEIRALAVEAGRDPDSIKVAFSARLAFLPDDWQPEDGMPISKAQLDVALLWRGQCIDRDLSDYPLDEPLPLDLEPGGIRSIFDDLMSDARKGLTLRESLAEYIVAKDGFWGTPEQVAEKMINFMEAVGGDGFVITNTAEQNGEFLDNVLHRLMPTLQAAGAIQTEYAEGTLRDRLIGLPAPATT